MANGPYGRIEGVAIERAAAHQPRRIKGERIQMGLLRKVFGGSTAALAALAATFSLPSHAQSNVDTIVFAGAVLEEAKSEPREKTTILIEIGRIDGVDEGY